MNEVTPGIYQLKLPLPGMESLLGYVNSYLIKGDKGYLIVDTGLNTNGSVNSLKNQMAEIGAGLKDITQVVITHIHPDHYGLVGRIKQVSRAKFYLHELERDMIDSRYIHMDDLLDQMARWLTVNGVPPMELANLQTASVSLAKFVSYTLPDVILKGGETISAGNFNFEVIWTPGHSPGQISLYERSRKILLSGDHVLPTITPNIGLHPQSAGNPLGDFVKSLRDVAQLDVDLILPGHESPFTGLKERVEKIIEHHEQRNAEILAAMKTGPGTGYEIARKITWLKDIGGAGWPELSVWDKRLAVLETLAHLESMRSDGKVDKFSQKSLVYYQLK